MIVTKLRVRLEFMQYDDRDKWLSDLIMSGYWELIQAALQGYGLFNADTQTEYHTVSFTYDPCDYYIGDQEPQTHRVWLYQSADGEVHVTDDESQITGVTLAMEDIEYTDPNIKLRELAESSMLRAIGMGVTYIAIGWLQGHDVEMYHNGEWVEVYPQFAENQVYRLKPITPRIVV